MSLYYTIYRVKIKLAIKPTIDFSTILYQYGGVISNWY